MTIYLAGRYSRRAELARCAAQLRERGHTVTSRWLEGDHEMDASGLSAEANEAERRRFALEDLEDLRNARVLIAFTEAPRAACTRGGRHVEFGVAVERGMPLFIVGPVENVFHALPGVQRFDAWEALLQAIDDLAWFRCDEECA